MIDRVDLLVVGGLTIDRFADGRLASGGSVTHAGLAAAGLGARIATLTVCGDEPEAAAGIARLRRQGPVIRQPSPTTVTFAHSERDGRRVLVFERGCHPLADPAIRQAPRARVALLAPIADELPPGAIEALRRSAAAERVVLLAQGWLRSLRPGEEVAPLALDQLAPEVLASFSTVDAIVLSTEDLADGAGDPFAQARLLREVVGTRPLLAVTLGADGFILDDPSAPRLVASVPRRVVRGVPSVGAGDAFGAGLALALGRGTPLAAAEAGADAVIGMLEGRRGSNGGP
ncbi:MAG: PfkB family carbohydrate kinase [Candidatus Limnocylindria bacterium]